MEFNSYFSVNNEDMPQDLLKSMKKNASDTISVASKDNPRLKKYQDSLNLYNKGEKSYKERLAFNKKNNIPISSTRKWNDPVEYDKNSKLSKIQPIEGNGYWYNENPDNVAQTNVPSKLTDNYGFRYKKPVQPVKYQKSESVQPPKAEVKAVKGSKKYFINETEVDEPTFNKIAPIKSMKKNEK